MTVDDAFEELMQYAHIMNWVPDLELTKEIYQTFPASYSILTPFAYSFLEELIRSTTSQYGRQVYDDNWNELPSRKVGIALIKLAIKENEEKNPGFVSSLHDIKKYYYQSKWTDEGDNRHSVAHGYMHPRYWSKESFEKLILDIAKIAKHAGF